MLASHTLQRGVLFEVVTKREFGMQSNESSCCSDSEIREVLLSKLNLKFRVQRRSQAQSTSTLTYAPRYTASELPLGTCGSPQHHSACSHCGWWMTRRPG